MTNKIHPSINEIKHIRWCASTDDLRALDSGFEALAKSAEEKISQPTILITRGEFFEKLIPKSLRDCPAAVIWLPDELSGEIFDLAYTTPTVSTRTSEDLTERDLVISWCTHGIVFTTFESALHDSIRGQGNGGAISVIFATATRTAITALSIDSYFLQELSDAGARCGEHYRPSIEHSAETLRAAARKHDPCDACFDEEGRCVILLRPRRAVRPDRIV